MRRCIRHAWPSASNQWSGDDLPTRWRGKMACRSCAVSLYDTARSSEDARSLAAQAPASFEKNAHFVFRCLLSSQNPFLNSAVLRCSIDYTAVSSQPTRDSVGPSVRRGDSPQRDREVSAFIWASGSGGGARGGAHGSRADAVHDVQYRYTGDRGASWTHV